MKANEKLLLIDSVGAQLYVALVGAYSVEERIFDEQRAHDRNINRLTRDFIPQASAFAVVTGPGSWTGSRVGVVAVKAYAITTGKPVVELQIKDRREELIKEARRKFTAGEFTDVRELAPYYDAEFKVTVKKTQ